MIVHYFDASMKPSCPLVKARSSTPPKSSELESDCSVSPTFARPVPRLTRLICWLASLVLVSRLLWVSSELAEQQPWQWLLLDSGLLLLLLLPLAYSYYLRPFHQHVRQIADAQARHREQAERLKKMLDNAFDGFIVIRPDGVMEEFNRAAEVIFGISAADAKGRDVNILMPPADRKGHAGYVAGYLRTGQRKVIGKGREMLGMRSNGEIFPIELAITEMEFQGELRFVGTVRDITRRKQAEDALHQTNLELEQRVQQRTAQLADVNTTLSAEIEERKRIAVRLKALATTDGLTGILNRREFDRLLHAEFDRAQRYGSPLALIMLDIDYFKTVNDRYGHSAGDAVLIDLTRLVASLIRAHDLFGRWGGEEFILLAPGCTVEGALQLAEKLRQAIAQHSFTVPMAITCSFGVTDCSDHANAASMLEEADQLLYAAKDGSRNRVNGPTHRLVTAALLQ